MFSHFSVAAGFHLLALGGIYTGICEEIFYPYENPKGLLQMSPKLTDLWWQLANNSIINDISIHWKESLYLFVFLWVFFVWNGGGSWPGWPAPVKHHLAASLCFMPWAHWPWRLSHSLKNFKKYHSGKITNKTFLTLKCWIPQLR